MNGIIELDYLDKGWVPQEVLVKLDEGSNCPHYCQGYMKLATLDGCTCFKNPSCHTCVDNFFLKCTECGFSFDKHEVLDDLKNHLSDEEYKELMLETSVPAYMWEKL